MKGKILDINNTDAFISLEDGTTMDMNKATLPHDSKVGDTVNIDLNFNNSVKNDLSKDNINNIF